MIRCNIHLDSEAYANSMSVACRSSTCPQGLPQRPTWLPTLKGRACIRWRQRWALPTGPARQLCVWVCLAPSSIQQHQTKDAACRGALSGSFVVFAVWVGECRGISTFTQSLSMYLEEFPEPPAGWCGVYIHDVQCCWLLYGRRVSNS